ncbi:MAG: YceK/YidQ family lipoprotein [Methylomicrobium sp.]
MKLNIGRRTTVILLSILMLGCSSIRTRYDILDENNKWKMYPGVRQDVKDMGKIVRGQSLKNGEEKSAEPGWIKGVVAFMLVFDLPFSTVFDTVVAPYDLYRIYNPQDFRNDSASTGP